MLIQLFKFKSYIWQYAKNIYISAYYKLYNIMKLSFKNKIQNSFNIGCISQHIKNSKDSK